MKTKKKAPSRRNPIAACLSHGAYQPKRVPSALRKAQMRLAKPKHRQAFMLENAS